MTSEEQRKRRAEINKRYRLKNKEKIAEIGKTYYTKNKETILEKAMIYRSENKERRSAVQKKYNDNNKGKIKKIDRDYRAKNSDKIKQKQKEYRSTEYAKENKRIDCRRRRALKKTTADGTITKESLDTLLHSQDNKCYHCGCELDNTKHLDHFIPISKGGVHSINNVVWSCPSCNLKKSATVPLTLF